MWKHPSSLEVNKIKKKYKRIFKPMQDHVNEWDPIGLISGGAPEDEYDCLTSQLIILLEEGKTDEEIYIYIIRELDDHFGMGIDSVSEEYKEQFILKHKKFSGFITEWYMNNEA